MIESLVGTFRFPDRLFGVIGASLDMAAKQSYEIIDTNEVVAVRETSWPGRARRPLRCATPMH